MGIRFPDGMRRTGRLLALLLCLVPTLGHADDREAKIKAAYLYNFFHYVTWPNAHPLPEGAPANICLYHAPGLYQAIDYVAKHKSGERPLNVRKLDKPEDAAGCHILYFTPDDAMRSKDYRSYAQAGVLLVGEDPSILDINGGIELSREGQRVVMSINRTMLTESGFRLSSRLLRLAQEVR